MSGVLMTSCIDTTILPVDKTTGEDYWKDKSQVQGMVNGAYKQMVTSDVMERLIVWGGFRSDELDYSTDKGLASNTTRNNLQKISYGNLENDNPYNTWAALYNVINRCNIVLERAPATVSIDPAYTEETFNTDKSQMLALRALCYFYLVRTFRDVPYSSVAFVNSSQEFEIPQTAPATVLENCINDLEEAAKSPLSATGYEDWRRTGLINSDAIKAILADIYLWRGSVMHNADDYQKCVDYCNEIIESKKSSVRTDERGASSIQTDSEYPLISGDEAFQEIFVDGNSDESIFELQMDGNNDVATAIRNYYFDYNGGNPKTGGFLQATKIFGAVDNSTSSSSVYMTAKDRRYYDNVYSSTDGEDGTSYPVRKMVDYTKTFGGASTTLARTSKPDTYTGLSRVSAGKYAQNWIIYRLTDIMLMKAEALVQLASSDADEKLTEAFELVDAVNRRSIATDASTSDYLAQTNYDTKDKMEALVLEERQRELCFEGKRWFDLLRYNFRHVTPADYTKTYYEVYGDATTGFVSNYSGFMTLLQRRYVENAAAICSKMQTEPYLYYPVPYDDMKVNSQLHQNPVYAAADKYERN